MKNQRETMVTIWPYQMSCAASRWPENASCTILSLLVAADLGGGGGGAGARTGPPAPTGRWRRAYLVLNALMLNEPVHVRDDHYGDEAHEPGYDRRREPLRIGPQVVGGREQDDQG